MFFAPITYILRVHDSKRLPVTVTEITKHKIHNELSNR